MPLLSDHEAFDKQAGQRAEFVLDHKQRETRPTILDFCFGYDWPAPKTASDLARLFDAAEAIGVTLNVTRDEVSA